MTRLLLHPIGLDAGCWAYAGVAGEAVDLPGHGGRSGEPVPATAAEVADHLAAGLTGPVDLVGISYGGLVAQHLLARHPDKVRSAVLGMTSARPDPAVLLARAAAAARGMPAVAADTLTRWFDRIPGVAPPGVDYARRTLLAMDPAAFAASWRAMAAGAPRLGRQRVPVTVLAADRDASVPAAHSAELAAATGGRLVTVPGPHLAFLLRPLQF